MSPRTMICFALMMTTSAAVWADDAKKEGLKALHQKLESLKKERHARVEQTKAQFQKLIKSDKLTDKEMKHHHDELVAQRDHLLSIAQGNAERSAIHKCFDPSIQRLSRKEHMEKKDIDALRQQEKQLIAMVHKQYDAAIKAVQQQIDALKKQPDKKVNPNKKKR